MNVVVAICLVVLAVSAGLFLLRALRPTASLPDRLVAMDGLLLLIACGVLVAAVGSGDGTYLPVVVVVALIAFAGTVTVARYIEQRGSR